LLSRSLITNALLTPMLSTTNHATATSRDSITFEIQRALAAAILPIKQPPETTPY
jgi:hypothetical protein